MCLSRHKTSTTQLGPISLSGVTNYLCYQLIARSVLTARRLADRPPGARPSSTLLRFLRSKHSLLCRAALRLGLPDSNEIHSDVFREKTLIYNYTNNAWAKSFDMLTLTRSLFRTDPMQPSHGETDRMKDHPEYQGFGRSHREDGGWTIQSAAAHARGDRKPKIRFVTVDLHYKLLRPLMDWLQYALAWGCSLATCRSIERTIREMASLIVRWNYRSDGFTRLAENKQCCASLMQSGIWTDYTTSLFNIWQSVCLVRMRLLNTKYISGSSLSFVFLVLLADHRNFLLFWMRREPRFQSSSLPKSWQPFSPSFACIRRPSVHALIIKTSASI